MRCLLRFLLHFDYTPFTASFTENTGCVADKPSKPEWKDKLKDKINSEYENSISHLVNRVTNFIVDEGDKLGYFEKVQWSLSDFF